MSRGLFPLLAGGMCSTLGLFLSFGTAQNPALGATPPASSSHLILPPANPPANIPANPNVENYGPPCFSPSFAAQFSSPACIDEQVKAIDNARAAEGIGPMYLPSDFSSLSLDEQIFVVTDLERVDRGLVPFAGLVDSLDQVAQTGAQPPGKPAGYWGDPILPSGFSLGPSTGLAYACTVSGNSWSCPGLGDPGASIAAAGQISPLDADYGWMYEDGYGTFNIDCTSPSDPGCWGHRDNILGPYPTSVSFDASAFGQPIVQLSAVIPATLVMGAGALQPIGSGNPGGTWSAIFTSMVGTPPPFVYSWSQALAAGADSPPFPIVAGISPSRGGTSGGTTVTITGSDFSGASSVTIGGVPATGVTVVSQSEITAVVPAHGPGTVDVVVTTPNGTSAVSCADQYRFGTPTGAGYWIADVTGDVFACGDTSPLGSLSQLDPSSPPGGANAAYLSGLIVSLAITPDARGYWLTDTSGNVYAFGDAAYRGSISQLDPAAQPGGANAATLPAPVVSMAATPDGRGYWYVDTSGDVYSFGDASYLGSISQLDPAAQPGGANAATLPAPVVSMAATPDAKGYWMIDDAGDVYSFGDASYQGSIGQLSPTAAPGGANAAHLAHPMVEVCATPDAKGYWMIDDAGDVYSFGDASYQGSIGQLSPTAAPGGANAAVLSAPIVSMTPTSGGGGYWMLSANGGVFSFGNAGFAGSVADLSGIQRTVGIAGVG